MKKKILSGVFALALLATVGFGVNKSMSSDAQLSDLALANVEALAQENGGGESGGNGAHSILFTDEGSGQDCIYGKMYNYVIIRVNCFGTGSLPCTEGTYKRLTPTGYNCYFT